METIKVSGPMFEPSNSEYFRSVHGRSGAHYNTYGTKDEDGMAALRQIFPTPEDVNEMNFVLFSTSGVHGMYTTIEEVEAEIAQVALGVTEDEYGDPIGEPLLTFLMIQPRIVCLRYGNCQPKNAEDIAYLKALRAKSREVFPTIG